MGLSENRVPLHPMVLLILIPTQWLFHWEYTPFSDIPRSEKNARNVSSEAMANTSSLASRLCRRSSLWSSDSADMEMGPSPPGFWEEDHLQIWESHGHDCRSATFFFGEFPIVWFGSRGCRPKRPRMVVILPRTLIAVFLMWWPGGEFMTILRWSTFQNHPTPFSWGGM